MNGKNLLNLLAIALPLLASSVSRVEAQFSGYINKGLIGAGRLPAASFDQLGTNIDTLGGYGSGIFVDALTIRTATKPNGETTFTGTFYAVPDRGFGDGANDWHARVDTFQFSLTPYYGTTPVTQTQIALTNSATLLLTDERGAMLTGADADDLTQDQYPRSSTNSVGQGRRSLDSEGIVRLADGGYFISDEYGASVYRFNAAGRLQSTLPVPPAFVPRRAAFPAGSVAFTATNNPASGRRSNRGFEGLSISPDGKRLFVMLQSPLIQDGGVSATSRNTRLLVYDLEEGSPTVNQPIAEYVYQLTLNGSASRNTHTPVSEVLALNREELLVLERDGLGLGNTTNTAPLYKRVVLASTRGASNILNTPYDLAPGAPGQLSLPNGTLPTNIVAMTRLDFVDLLNTNELQKFGFNISTNQDTNTLSSKWESLALVPARDPSATNDFFLLINNDNDFQAPRVYHNGKIVGTNDLSTDNVMLAYRVTLPTYNAPAPANNLPVALLSGPGKRVISAPGDFTLTAGGLDADGIIVKAEFFEGTNRLTQVTQFPFTLRLTNVAVGTHTYRTVVTDNSGATNSISTSVTVDDVRLTVGTNTYVSYRPDLPTGTPVFLDADPAADSPIRATQRTLGYREIDYKSVVQPTLFFQPVAAVTNGTTLTYDYTAQLNKTNLVGFWVAKDLPVMIGPDGNAYITDGHHTTAGYMAPASPVRTVIPGRNRLVTGHVVANFYDATVGPQPVYDGWWTARAKENNALLYGANGNLLTLPAEPGYTGLQPILPSASPMPTTPSNLSTNGSLAMSPNAFRELTWGTVDGVVVSATDAAGKKIAGYLKAPPWGGPDINFVEFYWADFLRNRIAWNNTLSGSPFGSTNGDASAISAPLSFFAAVANGIALSRSDAYRDQYGRGLKDYMNTNRFSSNVVFWAGASYSNGLASASQTYHLLLRDDSAIIGDIAPGTLSTNILHIDTDAGMVLTQSVQNVRSLVINGGHILKTSWKDATVPNSTLRFPAGTGTVVLNDSLSIGNEVQLSGGSLQLRGALTAPVTTVSGGRLELHGRINGALVTGPGASLIIGDGIAGVVVSGPLALGGSLTIDVEKVGNAIRGDRITGISTVTYGGSLTIRATGDSFGLGDRIKIFNASSYAGYFADGLSLPGLPPGLAWDASRLTLDGSLIVVDATTNLPPVATLVGPTNATLASPARFSLGATGTDATGALGKVEIFEGYSRVGVSTSGKLDVTLQNVAAGTHRYVAVATDLLGAVGVSPTFTVVVTASNQPPSVTIVSPASGTTFLAPARVNLQVNVSDPDGPVSSVSYYSGTNLLGVSRSSPFGLQAFNLPVGTNQVTAIAADAQGGTRRSAPISVVVGTLGVQVGTNVYTAFRPDLAPGSPVFLDADPAAGSPIRATQRSLGYREVDYKSLVQPTLFFQAVTPSTNGVNVVYDYSAQANKTNVVGFWAAKDLPVIIGPDGSAYITDGHHTTAGYMAPASPVRTIVAGLQRVVIGHVVANYFDPSTGPQPVTDAWWIARANENNALLQGPDGNLLALPADPGYAALQPVLPSVRSMPTTPSNLSTNGSLAMAQSLYRELTWGTVDAIVVSAIDAAGRKIAGYSKAPPWGGSDINFVEFYWADFMRNRIAWNNSLTGSPLTSTNGDASATSAPLSFFTAVANGIALSRSDAYRDQYGRGLKDYMNTNLFSPNVVLWAGASYSNGLASASQTYHLFLRDDSTIVGDISPGTLSTNILHIDTDAGLTITQDWRNVRSLMVNQGFALKTSWKDATVSNTTLRLPAGNGKVVLAGSYLVSSNVFLHGGSLLVNAALTCPDVQVVAGTLGGSGRITGGLTVGPNGTLAPGDGIGGLVVTGPVTLRGNTLMQISKTDQNLNADRLSGPSLLTLGGRLTVVASGDALEIGDRFKLFSARAYAGFFLEGVTLPVLPPGMDWDTSRLAVDGTLAVVSSYGNLPPVVRLTGPTNLTFSAPAQFTLKAAGADTNGSVVELAIYEGFKLLATGAGSSLEVTLTNVPAGVHRYTAVATDNLGLEGVSSPTLVNVTVSNVPPSIVLISPTNGATFRAPAVVDFAVSVSDPDDSIAKVDYFRGSLRVGTATRAPFSLSVTNFPFGTSTLTAVAMDVNGAFKASQEVRIQVDRASSASELTLQILHASDFEAGIAAIEDAVSFSRVLGALKAGFPTNTLVLSSGDNYIPGPFFNASSDPSAPFNGVQGRGDIAILNALGVQASTFGNHEFDNNTATVRNLLLPDASASFAGTQFPYLSANLDFAKDSNLASLVTGDGQVATVLSNKIARSAVVQVAGQTVGLVGATTADLRQISSPGNVAVNTNLVASIQDAVDGLLALGANKIILMSHLQQYDLEFGLAQQLRDVDVIIAGGSHAVFAKPTDHLRPDDTRAADYPTSFKSATGEPVLVVNTGANYRYVGRLIVRFGTNGVVTAVDPSSGAYATDDVGVKATGSFPPIAAVVSVATNLGAIIDLKDGVRFGKTTEYLNGLRQTVRTEESNLGDVTADANLWYARQFDTNTSVSIKNGGGIRDSIGAIASVGGRFSRIPPVANPRVGKLDGEISQLDIENALRFNNGLSLLTVTAQQLRDTFEWAVAATTATSTPGQFPQVAGVSFSFHPTNAPMAYFRDTNNTPTGISYPGARLQSLVVTMPDGRRDLVVQKGALVGNPTRTFRLVTLDFMANGGDTYYPLTLGTNRIDLTPATVTNRTFTSDGGEQKAMAGYLKAVKTVSVIDTPVAQDLRIQNLSARADTVILPAITRMLASQGGVQLMFQTLPAKHYVLQVREHLDADWMDSNIEVVGDGYERTVTDDSSVAGHRFYRLFRKD